MMRLMRVVMFFALLVTTAAAHAQKTLTDGVAALAEQVIGGLSSGKQRVAVIPLKTLKGETSMLGAYIAEELGTILATQKVQVIERALLESVMAELKLQESGAVDPATAKRVGKLIGADAIVTGTIAQLPTTLRINCKVITTETGAVLTGARTVITIDVDVQALIDDRTGRAPGSAPETAEDEEPEYSWKRGDIRYVIDRTERNHNGIYLYLALEHQKSTAQKVKVGLYYLIDDQGDRYNYDNDSEGFVEHGVTIPAGTRARSSFFFFPRGGGGRGGTTFSVVGADGTVVLRNLVIPHLR